MNERMHFVTRLESGERMTDLCWEFGISRKTGYKFLDRFLKFGPAGLYDESRRPLNSPQQTKQEVQKLILDLKAERSTWGARKLKEILERRHGGVKIPSPAAIHALLSRHGLVRKKNQRRTHQNQGTAIHPSILPNEIWCTDFKGQFLLKNQRYCYPLTISDHLSRYLIGCEGLENVQANGAQSVFEGVFREFGLPEAILSDNGPPFGCKGLFGLGQLSLWWIRLGIRILRIEPGHPEQNGRHERMHRTLKQETARPAGANFLQQQERFDRFRREHNEERPHEALDMKYPAELYRPSQRIFPKQLTEPEYPIHDLTRKVNSCGTVLVPNKRAQCFIGRAFVGQHIGLREEDEDMWRVTFVNLDLGLFDSKTCQFLPFDRPQPSGTG